MIKFVDFFNEVNPEKTKVKFNINDADKTQMAWDYLLEDDIKWINMNAWRSKSGGNNLGTAEYLLSLAQYYPYGTNYYAFGGLYKINKLQPEIFDGIGYNLELLKEYSEYRKRLIIKIESPIGRNNRCRLFYNIQDDLSPEIYEIFPPSKIGPFPGYDRVSLSWKDLHTIFVNEAPDWKEPLTYVKGIYCITDCSNGKIYIGSASGNSEGIWQRWSGYANDNNPTGGNIELKNLDKEYIKANFKYSILEIFDTKTKQETILAREKYWKDVFLSKIFGFNRN